MVVWNLFKNLLRFQFEERNMLLGWGIEKCRRSKAEAEVDLQLARSKEGKISQAWQAENLIITQASIGEPSNVHIR